MRYRKLGNTGLMVSEIGFGGEWLERHEVPESVRAHYEALERKASDCIGCRGCEERCPFGVAVAERMEKTAELFGC